MSLFEISCYRTGSVMTHVFNTSGIHTVLDIPATLDPRTVVVYDGKSIASGWSVLRPLPNGLSDMSAEIFNKEIILSTGKQTVKGIVVSLQPNLGIILDETDQIHCIRDYKTAQFAEINDGLVSRLRGFYNIIFSATEKSSTLSYGCTGINWYENMLIYFPEDKIESATFTCSASLYAVVKNELDQNILDAHFVFFGGNQGPRFREQRQLQTSFVTRGMAQYKVAAATTTASDIASQSQSTDDEETQGEVGRLFEIQHMSLKFGETRSVFIQSEQTVSDCHLSYFVPIDDDNFVNNYYCQYELLIPKVPWTFSNVGKVSIFSVRAGEKKMMAIESVRRSVAKNSRMVVPMGIATDVMVTDSSFKMSDDHRTKTITLKVKNLKKNNIDDFEIRIWTSQSVTVKTKDTILQTKLVETYYVAKISLKSQVPEQITIITN